MKSHTGSILTFSGERIWPLEPEASRIHAVDIAHALSNQCRYTGHVSDFYSVAEHTCRIYEILKKEKFEDEVLRWALLHDATEAYLVDLPAPLKSLPELQIFRKWEETLMNVIIEKFGLLPEEPEIVKYWDVALRVTEMRDLMGRTPLKSEPEPLAIPISTWSPRHAEKTFIRYLQREGLWSDVR